MYEPIVVTRKPPRTLAGTPIGKVFLITSLTILVVPFGGMYWLSEILDKKRKLINELNECTPKKLNLHEEYTITQDFWNRPFLRGVIDRVLQNNPQTEE